MCVNSTRSWTWPPTSAASSGESCKTAHLITTLLRLKNLLREHLHQLYEKIHVLLKSLPSTYVNARIQLFLFVELPENILFLIPCVEVASSF